MWRLPGRLSLLMLSEVRPLLRLRGSDRQSLRKDVLFAIRVAEFSMGSAECVLRRGRRHYAEVGPAKAVMSDVSVGLSEDTRAAPQEPSQHSVRFQ